LVNKVLLTVLIASVLFVSLVAYSIPAFANFNDLPDQSRANVIAVMGIGHIQGEPVIVEILVEIQPGENANQVTRGVLKANNLKPFGSADLGSDGFTVTGFFWPGVSPGLTQDYNPANEEVDGETVLTNTHSDWNGVTTSKFVFTYDDISDNCPSMAKECRGPQVFDRENTVGWLVIKERGVLAKAYFATHSTWGPETDIVLNTKYAWNGNCANPDGKIDVETVLRHENGHAAGIGHSKISTALMAPFYSGPNCDLDHPDDKEALTYLYDSDGVGEKGSVSGTVTDGDGTAIVGATVKLVGTTLGSTTVADGSYTISGIPDPVTYDVTASAVDFESFTKERITVDGDETGVDFTLTSSGGGSDGSDTGPTACNSSGNENLHIDVTMQLQQKGPWNHLLIPVHVSDGVNGPAESNVCVDIDLSRELRSWDLLGTTDSSGNIVFKLSKAWSNEPYTAEVVNNEHFKSATPASFSICKQIDGNNLAEC